MNVLDSPVEALTLNYVSFGLSTLVNNIWPLVAVITAAVSLWKIKASPLNLKSHSTLLDRHHRSSSAVAPQPEPETETEKVRPPSSWEQAEQPASSNDNDVAEAPVAQTSSAPSSEDDGTTKGLKFRVYYANDTTPEPEPEPGKTWDYDDDSVRDFGNGECGCEYWEKLLRIRKGDMSWYRYQDLTVLNGNVVRLWDYERRTVVSQPPVAAVVWKFDRF